MLRWTIASARPLRCSLSVPCSSALAVRGVRTGGAKAFRADPPARLRYAETAANRADATRREMALKRLARADKLALIQSAMCPWVDRDEESSREEWGRPLSPEELAASDPFARDRSSFFDEETTKPDQ